MSSKIRTGTNFEFRVWGECPECKYPHPLLLTGLVQTHGMKGLKCSGSKRLPRFVMLTTGWQPVSYQEQ